MSAFLAGIQQTIKKLSFGSLKQRAFLEDVAALVDDGVPANQAFAMIAKVAAGVTREVAENILDLIASGRSIAEGLSPWFPVAIVELVAAGEAGGTLAKTLQLASTSLNQRSKLFDSLLTSLSYPVSVVCLGLVVMVFIKHSILDDFATIKPIYEWPTSAQKLVTFSNFIQHWWWLVLVLFVVFGFSLAKLLRSYNGDFRQLLDSLPLLSLYRRFTAAVLMETLGLLIANGVMLKKALKIMHSNANPYLSWHLLSMEYRLGGGMDNIAEVLDTGLISDFDLQRLRAIATGRGFAHALLRQGNYATEQCRLAVSQVGKLLGGVLLLAGALLAAFMIFGIYGVGSIIGT